jgi:hypothetical protein
MSLSIASPTRSISSLASAPRPLPRNLRCSAFTLLASLALGCASQGVDLGGGVAAQSLQRGARCQTSTTVQGNVRVTNQQELDELEGCEQILGDLVIQLFAGANLAPLHALRIVDAGFLLGESRLDVPSDEQNVTDELVEEIVQTEAVLRGTWLTSLAGLESLERVGALGLLHTAVADLSPLAGLREIGGGSAASQTILLSNALVIQGNPGLFDLTGLEQVRGVTELQVAFNGALESLDGLTPDSEVTQLGLFGEPALTDLDALSAVTEFGSLTLDSIGITDLDAFSSVVAVDDVSIQFNPNLVDATGLGNIRVARSIRLAGNAALKTLPSLESYIAPPEFIVIFDNPELEELTFDFSQASTSGFFVAGRGVSLSIDGILIESNAKLRSVAFPPSPSEQLGLRSMQILAFAQNPSLTQIDFGGVSSVEWLVLDQNPALADVTLGDLSTVDTFQITNNPSLDANVFDSVRTFERIESVDTPSAAP